MAIIALVLIFAIIFVLCAIVIMLTCSTENTFDGVAGRMESRYKREAEQNLYGCLLPIITGIANIVVLCIGYGILKLIGWV